MTLVKKVSLVILIAGYAVAGINHFVHPAGYLHIIPGYIPFPKLMNVLAGIFEVLFAGMLVFKQTRRLAAWGIVAMLAAFMPVHLQMALDAPMMLGTLHVTPLGAWLRVVLQPVLMWWAWWCTKAPINNKLIYGVVQSIEKQDETT